MSKQHLAGTILILTGTLIAQVSAKVDFRSQVQPLFKEYCIDCHGPSQQMSGFRLDRRRDAMRGGAISDIGPGNSAGSRLYLKLIGSWRVLSEAMYLLADLQKAKRCRLGHPGPRQPLPLVEVL